MTIGVYAVMRHDLRKCYVGQSLNVERRIKRHLGGHSQAYVRTALIEPEGCAPGMFIRPCPESDLNDAEVALWDEMEASGWEIINQSRRKADFGGALKSSQAARIGGSIGGVIGGRMGTPAQIAARQANIRIAQAAGGGRVSGRMNTPAQVAARMANLRIRSRKGGRISGQMNTPAQATARQASLQLGQRPGGRAAMTLRRQCLDCGLTVAPAPMGRHLNASGHSGYLDVEKAS